MTRASKACLKHTVTVLAMKPMPLDKDVGYKFGMCLNGNSHLHFRPVPEHVIMNSGGRDIESSYGKRGHCKHPRAALDPSFSIKGPVNPLTRNAT